MASLVLLFVCACLAVSVMLLTIRLLHAAFQACVVHLRVECSCSARVASHPRSMDELLPGCVAGAQDP